MNDTTTTTSSRFPAAAQDVQDPDPAADRRLIRWGGLAGLAGVLLLLGSVVVVVSLGLPDASDVETLTDFDDIEAGRVAEHFFYLGALVMFALNVAALQRVLRSSDRTAALFGSVVALFGLGIMAASSMLHVSTRPLADRYGASGASTQEQQAVESAWVAAQSVFDTMLATGVLLVPIGLTLLGVAMRQAPEFGARIAVWCIVLGVAGFVGAAVEIVDSAIELSALSVLAIALFHLSVGRHMLRRTAATRRGQHA